MSWRLHLQPGDEIVIDTGDNELPPSIIISEIVYNIDDSVSIIDTEGNRHECLLTEIK